MSKKPKISAIEEVTFAEVMRGVKLLKHTKVTYTAPKSSPKINHSKKEVDVDLDYFSDYETLPLVGSEEMLQFSRSGIQHKILRNLRNGKYNVEETLDLHGKTVVEARQLLAQFLLNCQQNGVRHILVIHGKGRSNDKPILKNKLNHWLRQTEQVLAFCSATVRDGRSGAVYVLLKV